MRISILQEKLQKAKLIGAKQVALHEGELNINKLYGISEIKEIQEIQHNNIVVYGSKECKNMSIDDLDLKLENIKKHFGDIEVKGCIKIEKKCAETINEIKTVCLIAYKDKEDNDNIMALMSISDLK